MRAALFLLAPAIALAQIAGPVMGLVPDGAEVRVMYGMPAAGAVGPAIASGLSKIAISPGQNFAIGVNRDGAVVLALASGATEPVTGVDASPDSIAISPAGSAAALWFAATSHFEIVTGLPGAPNIRRVDATAFGTPLAFAAGDDGHLAASFAGGVEMFGIDGSVAPVAVEGRVLALTFLANSANLAMATATRVMTVADGSSTTLYQAAADAGRRLRASGVPAGIAVSIDNRWMAAAMRDGSVITADLAAGTASKSDCGCIPDGVSFIAGAAFRLTGGLNGVKLIEASSGNFLDVPPAAGGAQ
jgi:hypothetical protein